MSFTITVPLSLMGIGYVPRIVCGLSPLKILGLIVRERSKMYNTMYKVKQCSGYLSESSMEKWISVSRDNLWKEYNRSKVKLVSVCCESVAPEAPLWTAIFDVEIDIPWRG